MNKLNLLILSLLLSASAWARPKPLLAGAAAGADSAATAGDNAAGMTRFDTTNLRFDLYYLDSESTWENRIGDTPVSRTKTESDLIVPNGSIVVPLSEDWYFGFSMLAYSVSDDYGDDWIGKYAIQEYDLVFISAAPSIAYKINDNWSVAGTLLGTYTSFTQESAVRNFEAGSGDGGLEIDADGYTVGFGFSTLYEFTRRTRIGFTYTSALEPELDGDADFDNLDPTTESILDQAGLLDASIDVDTRSPQKAKVGIYHEFENRHAVTADINWIDFSNFKLAEIYVNDNQFTESDFEYDDIWAYSAGYSFPLNDQWIMAVAGVYVPSMVDDDNRQISLRLDDIWGVGAGFEYKINERLKFDITANYIEVGDSPIESEPLDAIGGQTISGRFIDRDLWLLQFGLQWGPGPRGGN